MSRAIKVDDQVYKDLDQLRGKGETFSQVIQELLNGRNSVFGLLNTLEGQTNFHEWKAKEAAKLSEAIAARGRPGQEVD